MKGVIFTNEKQFQFILEVCRFNNCRNSMHISTTMSFPDKYDFGISFLYLEKIPSFHVKNAPWFNFHPGPLPMYKGRNLCYHAIMNGTKEFGATIHYMDENFDTGDIIEVRNFNVLNTDTAETLSEQTIKACRQLLIEYFPRIIAGEEFPRIPNMDGVYYKKERIDDFIYSIPSHVKQQIRAITYKQFYPKIDVHGVTYKIVRDE